jgi:heat shock protein HslJ
MNQIMQTLNYLINLDNKRINPSSMQQLFIIATCCLLLTACRSNPQIAETHPSVPNSTVRPSEPLPPPEIGLYDHLWVLTSLNGKMVQKESYPHGLPTLEISSAKYYASGFSGCNVYGGDCQVDENNIRFGQLMGTNRYCKDVAEPEFYFAMGLADRFLITALELRLYANEKLLMTFTSGPSSPSLIID